MSEYNTKNYTEQNGEVTNINGTLNISGTLNILEGATVTGALLAYPSVMMSGIEELSQEDLLSIAVAVSALTDTLPRLGITIS